MKSLIVGIAGRTGSGKTTVANAIIKAIGKEKVAYIPQDSYYKDQSHIPYEERERINYDHPDTIEIELFAKHLLMLSKGEMVNKPVYDFITHTRKHQTEKILPKKIILADGIHVLTKETVRKIVDIKVFIDTDPDISFIRRLLRDTKERGRSVESVINQYIETVKPMQKKFVVPTKKYADIIIPGGGYNKISINKLILLINNKINADD